MLIASASTSTEAQARQIASRCAQLARPTNNRANLFDVCKKHNVLLVINVGHAIYVPSEDDDPGMIFGLLPSTTSHFCSLDHNGYTPSGIVSLSASYRARYEDDTKALVCPANHRIDQRM